MERGFKWCWFVLLSVAMTIDDLYFEIAQRRIAVSVGALLVNGGHMACHICMVSW